MDATSFGKAQLYTLTSDSGVTASFTNFGARWVDFWVPTSTGRRNLIVSYDSDEAYQKEDAYIGAIVGPVAGRLSGASFDLNGRTYQLTANEGNKNLHGGPDSLHNAYWEAEQLDETAIVFAYELSDGYNGYPGPLFIQVLYRLVGNSLCVDITATSPQDTLVNPTSHVYFNLDGDYRQPINQQQIRISADFYAPLRSDNTPTGQLLPVENTPFDFREFRPFSQGFDLVDPQNQIAKGYDHGWHLSQYDPQIEAISSDGSVKLSVTTNQPAVIIYTYGWPISPERDIVSHGAFTLETQTLPDAMCHPHFGDIVLKANDTFHHQTVFTVTTD